MMLTRWLVPFAFAALAGNAQDPNPLYKVHVVDSATVAVNYSNREMPTKIGMQGTVLLPYAKGDAMVQNRKGATEINLRLEGLVEPTRYGQQFLTYVAWALTPSGRAANLGQVLAGHNNKAKLRVSTELQTFALIVTAEPYYAVTQPGNVVVLENVVLPETQGRVETVKINAQLLPRGEVTYDTADAAKAAAAGPQKMVSMPEYEALLELYQAQNAIYRAQEAGADQAAKDIYSKAETLFKEAEKQHAAKMFRQVVATARQATQTAEDARLVAERKQRAPGI